MFPQEPYPGCTWPLTHHMGVVSPVTLYHPLFAATTYCDSRDPAADINSYLINNGLLTENIRKDSRQPETWRDYQQILSELGLIYSTNVKKRITPTTLGIAYKENDLSFAEVITLQALRYQYPNGHNLVISKALRDELRGTPFASAPKFAKLQSDSGVQLRPGVLVWRVLRGLESLGEEKLLTLDEIQSYLTRCANHEDTDACIAAIASSRHSGIVLSPLGESRGRRNAQDWMKFLGYSPLFINWPRNDAYLCISPYGRDCAEEIDALCTELETPSSFWTPGSLDSADRAGWYAHFGSINLNIGLIPVLSVAGAVTTSAVADEEADEAEITVGGGEIRLRSFDAENLGSTREQEGDSGKTITSSYDAGLADKKHQLHDLMVIYIASVCRRKGATVWDDPASLDLLAQYKGFEFLIEVKSVTPRNFIRRLRYAIGQVLHYDYLRSKQTRSPRRKVVAVTAQVTDNDWCIPFLNDHLDTDLLSLRNEVLRVNSPSAIAQELFTPPDNAPTLGV